MFIKTEFKNKKTNVLSCFYSVTELGCYHSKGQLCVTPECVTWQSESWETERSVLTLFCAHTVESLCGPSVSHSHTHRRGLWTVWWLPLLSLWCLSTLPACSRASHSGRPRWVTLPRRDDSVDCQKPSQHYRVLGAPHSQHAARLPDDS